MFSETGYLQTITITKSKHITLISYKIPKQITQNNKNTSQ